MRVLTLSVLALVGCAGRPESPCLGNKPEARLLSTTGLVSSGATVDLGSAPAHATVELELEVVNTGLGTLSAPRFEHDVFSFVGEPAFPLPSGSTVKVRVAGATGDVGSVLTDTLVFDREATCGDVFRFELVAHASAVDCPAAASLELGVCQRDETLEASLTLTNHADVTGTLTWDAPVAPFSVLTPSPLVIAPGATAELRVRYAPTQSVTDTGTLTLHALGCADQHVALTGTAVDQAIEWSPATLDFGALASASTTLQATFTNHVTRAITLSQLATFQGSTPATDFDVGVTELELPPATGPDTPSSRFLDVTFHPAVAGVTTGTLRASTNVPNQAGVVVPLRGERL